MELDKGLTPVSDIMENSEAYHKRPLNQQMRSIGNLKLHALPPLCGTSSLPQNIVDKYLTQDEYRAMIKHLSTYRKTRAEWDHYRLKIDNDLLEKWITVLEGCRRIGFVNPHIYQDEIIWNRILGFKRNIEQADKCTLCSNSQTKETCTGQTLYKKNQPMFVPCWFGN